MPLSKRNALAVSIGAILLYYLYNIISERTAPVLPEHFGELVLLIVRNKLIMFAALYLLLRLEGEGFEALGVRRAGWPRHVGIGLGIGVLMFLGLNVALDSVLNSIIPRAPSTGPSIMSFFADPWHLVAWLPIGIFGGGVVEELQRIFVITRFEKWLGRPGLILGVTLSSAMFGLGHRYQGVGTALSTAVSGLVFAGVYLRRRSALEPITAHAFSDVIAIIGVTLTKG